MKNVVLFLFIAISSLAEARVRVAFFEMHTPEGNLVQLEPGGRFFHLALQLADGRWIHTHPRKGVEPVQSVLEIGVPKLILVNELATPITLSAVAERMGMPIEKLIGLPFDFTYNWEDPNSTYCAKFVGGSIIGIAPAAADFAGEFWQTRPRKVAEVGLSPDDVYRGLRARGYVEEEVNLSCAGTLSPTLSMLYEAK